MMDDVTDVGGEPLYPHNVLEGFGMGALLDFRVRLAIDFLKAPVLTYLGTDCLSAVDLARGALDLADEVLKQGRARGWVTDLPRGKDIDEALREQAARTARYQVVQQTEGQKAASEEQGQVVPVRPGGGRH
jgi:hypothetical protein